MTDNMVEKVAKAIWDASGTPGPWSGPEFRGRDRFMAQARAAIDATAGYLDSMGTNSDEDMMAVEWISGLLHGAALSESQT